MMTIVGGAITSFSRKQKLNAKSSTETKLIGIDDALPQVLWTQYFMEVQGYKVKENIIMQDIFSAMKLEKNGKASSSRKTKHINISYFFMKDRIDNGEVAIKYCPTEVMWADVLMKPLQGAQF